MATAYAAVIAANPTDYQLYAGHAPYFAFNSTTDLITLYVDAGAWKTGTATLLPGIYLNTPLSNLLAGIPQSFISYNSVGGLDDLIQIPAPTVQTTTQPAQVFFTTNNAAVAINSSETSITVTATPFGLPVGALLNYTSYASSTPQQLTVSTAVAGSATTIDVNTFITAFAEAKGDQVFWVPPALQAVADETSSVASWFNAYSVAVESQQMPFRKQVIPGTIQAGGQLGDDQLAPQSIVADFLYPGQERLTSTNSLVYYPQAEWRWIDLISDGDVSFLDCKFSWSDTNGNLSPIILQPGETASVLFLFRQKHEHVVVASTLDTEEAEKMGGAFGGAGGMAGRRAMKRKLMMGGALSSKRHELALA